MAKRSTSKAAGKPAGSARRSDPKLWERVKREVTGSSKGGRPGQWSARKAQVAVTTYKKRGGGYAGAKPTDTSLQNWQREEWGTRSGRKSTETGERYLPKKAREALDDTEYRRTSDKKRADTRKGRQFSRQPRDVAAKTAPYRGGGRRKDGRRGEPTRAELLERARARGLPGRSRMTKAELVKALAR